MTMWIIIMYVTLFVTGISLLYLSNRVCRFRITDKIFGNHQRLKASLCTAFVFSLFLLVGLALNFMNAIVCAVYFAMIWLVCDVAVALITWVIREYIQRVEKQSIKEIPIYIAGIAAIAYSLTALGCGWYLAHNVWKTEYMISSEKLPQEIKVVGFADSHIGTTFSAEGFAKHIDEIQQQNPDIVVIAGDFVDDDTSKEDMIAACQKLGSLKTTYGVYFVFGNHDKGYYGTARRGFGAAELIAELEKNKVRVLLDKAVSVNDLFYIVGRKDRSIEKEQGGKRLSMAELTANLDRDKFIFVLDHQPADYDNQEKAAVDLVFSGHTHGGQLFPFNQVGKWIGANDMIYGHEKRGNTNFIVTSGLSDWAIKFKTGTKSEYVVIRLVKE